MDEQNPDKSNVVIVIPSFNEGDRVDQVVKQVKEKGFTRIVVVDDHSSDDSMENLRKHGVIILHHLLNRGAGAATETGLRYCRDHLNFETIITIDADTQHDPEDLNHLLEQHLLQNSDVTIGNRFMENSNLIPADKKFFNSVANIRTSLLCGNWISDSQSGFKAFSIKAVKLIILEQDKYEYCSEIFIKAYQLGLKVINVPVKSYYPESIKNKGQNLFHGINTFMNLVYSAMFKNK
jgi:glycosyltransferase involved in cell wall biosynthesis